MKIKRLTVENIKRISVVEITPKGDLVILTGRNSQGKSSIIDSICFALGGKDAMKSTPKPLREGAEKGRIVVELDEFIVTRWWTDPDTSYIKVTTQEGAVYPAPQALLDKWIGKLTFDPLEFLEMTDNAQVDWLMGFIGKKEELIKLNIMYTEKYANRSLVNKEYKKLKVYFEELPIPKDNLPELGIDMDTFEKRKIDSINLMNQILTKRTEYKTQFDKHELIKRSIKEHQEKLMDLETELGISNKLLKEIEEESSKLVQPEAIELIAAEKETGILLNAKLLKRDLKYKTENEMGDKKVEYDQLTEGLEEITKRKKDLIAKSDFPIKGLSFDEHMITYDGIPFKQCSQSDRLRVSFAIGMKMNPDLRVLMTRDANSLDEDNLKLLMELKETNNYQIWLERISENKLPAIIIEDGHIKGKPPLSPDNTKLKKEEAVDGTTNKTA